MSQNRLRLIITDEAYNDIDAIAAFIASDNPHAASLIVQIFINACKNLTFFPELGSYNSNIKNKNVRILKIKKNYIIAYQIYKETIVILKITNRYQNLYEYL